MGNDQGTSLCGMGGIGAFIIEKELSEFLFRTKRIGKENGMDASAVLRQFCHRLTPKKLRRKMSSLFFEGTFSTTDEALRRANSLQLKLIQDGEN